MNNLTNLRRRHKDQPRMLLDLANWMIARRNFEEAKTALNRVIELEEDSIVGLSAKTLLAKIAFDNKDFEGIRKNCRRNSRGKLKLR